MLADDKKHLEELISYLTQNRQRVLGYPMAGGLDHSPVLPSFNFLINEIGDPFVSSGSWSIEVKALEREVLAFFAKLYRAPADDYWGYITNGSTEGNLYGLYTARRLYPKGVVYYSAAAHYSIPKNIQILNMPGVRVKAQASGEIDYAQLKRAVARRPNEPAIIVATVGTTMTEARDNLANIKAVLKQLGKTSYYLHVDAALDGGFLPFLEPHHPFDFADGADSLVVSTHKFIGVPLISGLVMTRRSTQEKLQRKRISYIDTFDTTITGSRSGQAVLMVWYALKEQGEAGLRARMEQCLELAGYAKGQLEALGWPVWSNPNTITLLIKPPSKDIIARWQLATSGEWCHVICMPGVTKQQIDAFIGDLRGEAVSEASPALPATLPPLAEGLASS